MTIELIVLIILVVWLLPLSLISFWVFRYFRRLSFEVKKGSLIKILDKLLETQSRNTKEIKKLEKEIKNLSEEVMLHVQKVGFVRFNPFDELGGDHSFSLALLDGKDTGIVLTGLHTRERTRVYMKRIRKGKCKHELSNEEKRALEKAKKST